MSGYDIDSYVLPEIEEEKDIKVYNGVDYSRQMKLWNPFNHKDRFVTIVGAGAVGSMTAVTLAKMGFRNIVVWDDDIVTSENLPNQFYPINAVGQAKVTALQDIVRMFTGLEIITMNRRWDEAEHIDITRQFTDCGILIMCTDNMISRKVCFEYFTSKSRYDQLFIDARMGGLVYRVYMLNVRCIDVFGKPKKGCDYPLYTDDAAHQDPCTAKSIIFNVMGIASTIAGLIRLYDEGEVYYKEVIGNMKSIQIVDGNDITKLM